MAGNPTLTKSWTVIPNIAPGTSSYPGMLFSILTQLLALGWSVPLSSDSVSAGVGNKWLSSTNIVRGANTSAARSWIVAQSPAGRQILLDYVSGSTGEFLNVQMSPGALFTGGTISAAPTATDSFPAVANAARNIGPAGLSYGANRRMHFIQSTDGKNLIVPIYRSGSPLSLIMIGDVTDFHSAVYSAPTTFVIYGESVGSFANSISAWVAGAIFTGLAPTGPVNLRAANQMYWNGSAAVPVWLNGQTLITKNQLSNKFPIYDPWTFYSSSADYPGRFGTWPDVYATLPSQTGWTDADTIPGTGTPQFVHVADIIVPWPTATAMATS